MKRNKITAEQYYDFCRREFEQHFGESDNAKFYKRPLVYVVEHDIIEPLRLKARRKLKINLGSKYVDDQSVVFEEFERFKNNKTYVEQFLNLNNISTSMFDHTLRALKGDDQPLKSPILAYMRGEEVKIETFVCTGKHDVKDEYLGLYYVDDEFIREDALTLVQKMFEGPQRDLTAGLNNEFDLKVIKQRLESKPHKPPEDE